MDDQYKLKLCDAMPYLAGPVIDGPAVTFAADSEKNPPAYIIRRDANPDPKLRKAEVFINVTTFSRSVRNIYLKYRNPSTLYYVQPTKQIFRGHCSHFGKDFTAFPEGGRKQGINFGNGPGRYVENQFSDEEPFLELMESQGLKTDARPDGNVLVYIRLNIFTIDNPLADDFKRLSDETKYKVLQYAPMVRERLMLVRLQINRARKEMGYELAAHLPDVVNRYSRTAVLASFVDACL